MLYVVSIPLQNFIVEAIFPFQILCSEIRYKYLAEPLHHFIYMEVEIYTPPPFVLILLTWYAFWDCQQNFNLPNVLWKIRKIFFLLLVAPFSRSLNWVTRSLYEVFNKNISVSSSWFIILRGVFVTLWS